MLEKERERVRERKHNDDCACLLLVDIYVRNDKVSQIEQDRSSKWKRSKHE